MRVSLPERLEVYYPIADFLTPFDPAWYTVAAVFFHERRRTQMYTDIFRLNHTHILWVRLQMAD
jgi:hypothetical protein